MMAHITLAPRLDLSQVGPLAMELRSHAGSDLVLDAGAVSHLGGLALQLLAAAALSARDAGTTLTITPRSDAFDDALAVFGLSAADLQNGEAA